LAIAIGAVGLIVAVEIATIEGCEVPIVTLLRAFPLAVAADGGFARRPRRFALESVFELAARGATVGQRVSVVTLLEARNEAIAAFRRAASNARL
jgi:hypothetical protein